MTNVGTDYHHLLNMGEQARSAMGVETLEAIADRGYHEGYEILACEEAGITVTIPRRLTSRFEALLVGIHRLSPISRDRTDIASQGAVSYCIDGSKSILCGL